MAYYQTNKKDRRTREQKLTDLQRRYCYAYVETHNATEAAKIAGYSPDSAQVAGAKNKRNPLIKKFIEKLEKEVIENVSLRMEDVVRRLTYNLTRMPTDFFDEEGRPIPPHLLGPRAGACIDGIKWEETVDSEGNPKVKVEYKLSTNQGNIDIAMRHLGGYAPEQKEVVIKPDFDHLLRHTMEAEQQRQARLAANGGNLTNDPKDMPIEGEFEVSKLPQVQALERLIENT